MATHKFKKGDRVEVVASTFREGVGVMATVISPSYNDVSMSQDGYFRRASGILIEFDSPVDTGKLGIFTQALQPPSTLRLIEPAELNREVQKDELRAAARWRDCEWRPPKATGDA